MQQKTETILNIPFAEILQPESNRRLERYEKKFPYVQIEARHIYSDADPEVGIMTPNFTYEGFRPLAKYPGRVLDAIDAFMRDDASKEYHDLAYEKWLDYQEYLQFGLL